MTRKQGSRGAKVPAWQRWVTPIKTIPIHFEVKVVGKEPSAEDLERHRKQEAAEARRRSRLPTDKGD